MIKYKLITNTLAPCLMRYKFCRWGTHKTKMAQKHLLFTKNLKIGANWNKDVLAIEDYVGHRETRRDFGCWACRNMLLFSKKRRKKKNISEWNSYTVIHSIRHCESNVVDWSNLFKLRLAAVSEPSRTVSIS
jgi:hypothetical protein